MGHFTKTLKEALNTTNILDPNELLEKVFSPKRINFKHCKQQADCAEAKSGWL